MNAFVELSRSQADAFHRGVLPPVEEVSAGVHAVAVPMPGSALAFSYCYVFEGHRDEVHLFDTGLESEQGWEVLSAGLRSLGRTITDVSSVTVSHLHRDHIGLAARLQGASGALVRMHAADVGAMTAGATRVETTRIEALLGEWDVPLELRAKLRKAASARVAPDIDVTLDDLVEDGRRLEFGSHCVRVMHTPGHTRGHIVLVDDADRTVFTGDHLLPEVNSGVGLGGWLPDDDPIGDYVAGLGRLAELDDYTARPGHGYGFAGIGARCSAGIVHLEARRTQMRAIAEAEPGASVWDVASRAQWTAGWRNLSGGNLLSALQQTWWHLRR